ncbi:flippase [Chloroflexus sp.]|uniref:flippase n=1 Tax=Chloroflexus sp. TaxID=1904827 RepID=UPI00298F3E01|nr:flippase [Chloroflexus sp.]MDW8403893.1 flippase [Chloroflexus sp.]
MRDKLSPQSQLFYSSIHTLITNILSIIIGLVSSIVIARWFGPTVKGNYDLIITTSALLVTFFGLSFQSGIVYVVARRHLAATSTLLHLSVIALLQTSLAIAALVGLSNTALALALMPPRSEEWAAAAVVFLVLGNLLSGYYRGILIGLQEIPRVNVVNLCGQTTMLCAILISVFLAWNNDQQFSSQALICFQIGSTMLMAALTLWMLKSRLTGSIWGDSGISEISRYSLPSYFANLAQFLNYRLDIFFVSYFVGVTEVGLYSLAVNIAQLLWLISNSLSQALFTNVAYSSERIAAQQRTAHASRVSLWLSIMSALGLAAVGEFLLPLVFGSAFLESIPALLWLLPGITVFSVTNVIGSYLAGIGKPHLNLAVSLIGLIVTVVMDIALIPKMGIVGAAIASSASYLATTSAIVVIFARESKMSILDVLLISRNDLRALYAILARRVYETKDPCYF